MYRSIAKAFNLINWWIPLLIQTPRAGSYGNCAEEIFFGLLRAKREGKKILLFYPHNLFSRKLVANKKVFHIHSAYSAQNKAVCYLVGWICTALVVFRWALFTLSHLRRQRRDLAIGRAALWKPEKVDLFSWKATAEQDWKRQYDEYVPPSLLKNDHRHAEQLRVQMGLPLTDWFVCLHIRESGYRGDYGSHSTHRNSTLENYIKSVKAITDEGGWVVRIGDSSMTPFPQIERVIDYPHTRFKSELMDIYLISQCRFFLGTNSGPDGVATLFGKPMIIVNATEWTTGFPLKKGDLFITKHLFSRSANRFLSIMEILEEPFIWQAFGPTLDSNYVMVENTSEEIWEVVKEFLAQPANLKYSEQQETFNEGRRNQIHRWLNQLQEGAMQKYKMASRADPAGGTLGQKYLEQTWFSDDLELSSFS